MYLIDITTYNIHNNIAYFSVLTKNGFISHFDFVDETQKCGYKKIK